MSRQRSFLIQLENFDHEANVVAQYVYAEMAIQHTASQSKELLRKLNETPRFWIASKAAFQSAAYIVLGRIFDTKSPYNVNALLNSMEAEISLFSRSALADRKRGDLADDPPWLLGYLDDGYYPTLKDVKNLRNRVAKHREIYDRAIKPVRHKYLAHREKQERGDVRALYAQGKVNDLWRLVAFLLQLNGALWQLLHNGRKPNFRTRPYAIKSLFKSGRTGSTPEVMVDEVKRLMSHIELNNAPQEAPPK